MSVVRTVARARSILPVLVLLTLGCQVTDAPRLPQDSDDGAIRSVVRSLELGLTVEDLEASAASVRALAVAHDGSRVESASIREGSEDVTTQRVDVGARARSARAEEERLLAMLRDDTASLADVLAVEARLATVRERIELLEATERELASRVELAHVHVRLSTHAVPPWARPLTTLGDAAELGVHAAAGLAVGLAAFVVAAAPVVALLLAALALVVLPWRALGRRRARARLATNGG